MTSSLQAGSARAGGGGGGAGAPNGGLAPGATAQPAIMIGSPPRPPVQYRTAIQQPAPSPAPPLAPPPPPPHPPRSPQQPPSRQDHELRRMVIVYPTPLAAGPCVENYVSSSSAVTDAGESSAWTDEGVRSPDGAEEVPRTGQQQQHDAVGAAIARAQAAAESATQADVDSIRGRLELRFLADDAYQSAAAELADAHAAYDAAVARARAGMKDSTEYREAADDARRASGEVIRQSAVSADADSASANPPAAISPQLVRAAQAKLDAVTVLSKLQSGYVANQPDVIAAQARVTAAERKIAALRARFEALVANDPEWRAAERRLDAIRRGADEAQ
jgi:hypothetical protein